MAKVGRPRKNMADQLAEDAAVREGKLLKEMIVPITARVRIYDDAVEVVESDGNTTRFDLP